MTRSFKSPIPRSLKIENLAAQLAGTDEGAIDSTSIYIYPLQQCLIEVEAHASSHCFIRFALQT